MAYDDLVLGTAANSKIIEIMLRSSTTGMGATDLVHDSAGMTAYYIREGSTATQITLAHGAAGDPYSSGKFAEVSKANAPGVYQLHVPDAALATGAKACTIHVKATGIIDAKVRILIMGSDLRAAALAAANSSGTTELLTRVGHECYGRTIWYVSKAGNNANDGKTPQTAKLTIAAAVALVGQGEMIVVMPSATAYAEIVDLSGVSGITLRIMKGATIQDSTSLSTVVTMGPDSVVDGGGTIKQAAAMADGGLCLLCYPAASSSFRAENITLIGRNGVAACVDENKVLNVVIDGLTIMAGETALVVQEAHGIIRNCTIRTADYLLCSSIGISLSTFRGIVENNTLHVTIPVGNSSGSCAYGIQVYTYVGPTNVLLLNNDVMAECVTGTGAYAVAVTTVGDAKVTISGGKNRAVARSDAIDLWVQGNTCYADTQYATKTVGGTATFVDIRQAAADADLTAFPAQKSNIAVTAPANMALNSTVAKAGEAAAALAANAVLAKLDSIVEVVP